MSQVVACSSKTKGVIDNKAMLQDQTKLTVSPKVTITPQCTLSPTITPEIQLISESGDNCMLRLGMTMEKVKSILKETNVIITKKYQGEDDNNKPNGYWIWDTKDVQLLFDLDKCLYEIDVYSNLPTALGLRKGDTLQKMHALYGKENKYDKAWDMYIYKIKNHNFGVVFNLDNDDGKVSGWELFLDN